MYEERDVVVERPPKGKDFLFALGHTRKPVPHLLDESGRQSFFNVIQRGRRFVGRGVVPGPVLLHRRYDGTGMTSDQDDLPHLEVPINPLQEPVAVNELYDELAASDVPK